MNDLEGLLDASVHEPLAEDRWKGNSRGPVSPEF